MTPEEVLREFLKCYYHTVATSALEKHLDLWSRRVQLYGVPGREVLGYDEIALRRRNEFNRCLLVRVVFSTPEILHSDEQQLTYRVRETMKATTGAALAFDAEVTLVNEPDGVWRIREEHISNPEVITPTTEPLPAAVPLL